MKPVCGLNKWIDRQINDNRFITSFTRSIFRPKEFIITSLLYNPTFNFDGSLEEANSIDYTKIFNEKSEDDIHLVFCVDEENKTIFVSSFKFTEIIRSLNEKYNVLCLRELIKSQKIIPSLEYHADVTENNGIYYYNKRLSLSTQHNYCTITPRYSKKITFTIFGIETLFVDNTNAEKKLITLIEPFLRLQAKNPKNITDYKIFCVSLVRMVDIG